MKSNRGPIGATMTEHGESNAQKSARKNAGAMNFQTGVTDF